MLDMDGVKVARIMKQSLEAAHEWMIENRIATYDGGYPLSEAQYETIDAWIEAQEKKKDV